MTDVIEPEQPYVRIDGSWEARDLDVARIRSLGHRWVRTAFDGDGRWQKTRWSRDEYTVLPEDDRRIVECSDAGIDPGIQLILNLGLWTPVPDHVGPRFKTAAEFERYMNYVQFAARHFSGRIAVYEIWNEPDSDIPGYGIDLSDYVDVIRVVTPIIRAEDPSAKIAVGAAGPGAYLSALASSYVMQTVDMLTWYVSGRPRQWRMSPAPPVVPKSPLPPGES